MDAQDLGTQVNDLVKQLTSREQHQQNNAVREYFAPDAVLETPLTTVKGTQNIRELADLRTSFQKDKTVTVSKIKWDDEQKTASFSVKARYALPLTHAPWPWSLGRHFSVTIPSDVQLFVTPDDRYPVRSEATEASKYHVSRVVTRLPPPRSAILAAAFGAVLFVVRIVAPYVISVLVVINKFFQRHPLSEGYIRTGIAALHELVVWVLQFIRTQLGFTGAKRRGAKKSGDGPSSGAVQDTAEGVSSALRDVRPGKVLRDVQESKPVKEAVKFAEDSVKAVQDSETVKRAEAAIEAARDSEAAERAGEVVHEAAVHAGGRKPEQKPDVAEEATKAAQEAGQRAAEALEAFKESEPVKRAEKAVEDVKDSEAVKEATKRAEEAVEAVKESEPVKEAEKVIQEAKESKPVKDATKEAEQLAKDIKDSEPVKEASKEANKLAKDVKESEPVKEAAKEVTKDKHDHKDDHHKHKHHGHKHTTHTNNKTQPAAPAETHTPAHAIPLKKLDKPTASAVKAHDAPAPIAPSAPEHDAHHPSFADIAAHQPPLHATDEHQAEGEFPALPGHKEDEAVPIPEAPAAPSFADVAAEPEHGEHANQDSATTSASEEGKEGKAPAQGGSGNGGGKKKKGKKGRKH